MTFELYTIGHSNHPIQQFISLLTMHGITAVCDVRSYPQSKSNPQFYREAIQLRLEQNNIKYVFCGKELGGRSTDANVLDSHGHVDYNLQS